MQQYSNLWQHQFKPENPLVIDDKLKDFEPELLKALLQEMKSTKNWLLIEQKKYSTPVEIAYRDWAIITIDILINKVINALSSKVKSED